MSQEPSVCFAYIECEFYSVLFYYVRLKGFEFFGNLSFRLQDCVITCVFAVVYVNINFTCVIYRVQQEQIKVTSHDIKRMNNLKK